MVFLLVGTDGIQKHVGQQIMQFQAGFFQALAHSFGQLLSGLAHQAALNDGQPFANCIRGLVGLLLLPVDTRHPSINAQSAVVDLLGLTKRLEAFVEFPFTHLQTREGEIAQRALGRPGGRQLDMLHRLFRPLTDVQVVRVVHQQLRGVRIGLYGPLIRLFGLFISSGCLVEASQPQPVFHLAAVDLDRLFKILDGRVGVLARKGAGEPGLGKSASVIRFVIFRRELEEGVGFLDESLTRSATGNDQVPVEICQGLPRDQVLRITQQCRAEQRVRLAVSVDSLSFGEIGLIVDDLHLEQGHLVVVQGVAGL